MDTYFAHSENARGEKETLEVHLKKAAILSRQYATAFGEEMAGEWLGWFHDAGKA